MRGSGVPDHRRRPDPGWQFYLQAAPSHESGTKNEGEHGFPLFRRAMYAHAPKRIRRTAQHRASDLLGGQARIRSRSAGTPRASRARGSWILSWGAGCGIGIPLPTTPRPGRVPAELEQKWGPVCCNGSSTASQSTASKETMSKDGARDRAGIDGTKRTGSTASMTATSPTVRVRPTLPARSSQGSGIKVASSKGAASWQSASLEGRAKTTRREFQATQGPHYHKARADLLRALAPTDGVYHASLGEPHQPRAV